MVQTFFLTLLLALSLGLSSCLNVFAPIDSPSTDYQYISKARACFDEKDLTCAREYYAKASNSFADTRESELAFVELDSSGATMGDFMSAFSGGGGGDALTKFANKMAPGNVTKRQAILSAYRRSLSITDPSLRGLVRFASATALAAEILSESTGGDNIVNRADVVGTGCDATNACAGDQSLICSTSTIVGGAADINLDDTTQTLAGAHDLSMLKAAMSGIIVGLGELGASGKFSTGVGDFATQINAVSATTEDGDCFRFTLGRLSVGIAAE